MSALRRGNSRQRCAFHSGHSVSGAPRPRKYQITQRRAGVWLHLVAPVVLAGLLSAELRAHCPLPGQPVAGNFRVWIRIINVGDVMFWAYGPHVLHSVVDPDNGWFVSVLMDGYDAQGRRWGAEGHQIIPDPEGCGLSGTGGGGPGESVSCITEYICVDVWDEEAGTWQVWWCGWATTCT